MDLSNQDKLKQELSDSIDLSSLKDVLNDSEYNTVETILRELSNTGNSRLLYELYSEDYEEIPVDIETFIKDPQYLGNSFMSSEGKCLLYPYWINMLKSLFAPDSPYYECAITGSIGTGKTTVAVVGICYVLYKLLCLKNPAQFYELSGGSKVAIAFINVDMNAAYGVAYSRVQEYCKASPWFLKHGTLVGLKYPTYYPDKKIEMVVGSKPSHFIGRDIFCLTGDTVIITLDGARRIDECVNKRIKVLSYDIAKNKLVNSCYCTVEQTGEVDELVELEFDNGTKIRCTKDHKLMLKDGSYKRAIDITEDDDLMEVN